MFAETRRVSEDLGGTYILLSKYIVKYIYLIIIYLSNFDV